MARLPNLDLLFFIPDKKKHQKTNESLDVMLNPNLSKDEFSDALLVSEYHEANSYKPRQLYALMARRADDNDEIKRILLDLILSETARREKEMGFITHAWLPAIFILKEGGDKIKLELRQSLKQWSAEEKELFLNYIEADQEYYGLLQGI